MGSEFANLKADVVIIGGGPAGSVAAKKCAEKGFHTILLEKKRLPRRKVCSGMLLSKLVHVLIDNEFGPIPESICDHPKVLGYQWHTTEFGVELVDMPGITNTWRKNLDYWMNQKAKEAGAEIWEEALVKNVIQQPNGVTIKLNQAGERKTIEAKFVIGADGANSVTRKSIFPGLNIRLIGIYSECHPGALDLDPRYYHIFGSARTKPTPHWFDVIHKKDCFVIETNGYKMSPKEAMIRAKEILADDWGLSPISKALWTEGCTVSFLRKDLLSGVFLPAKGNVLLVGGAAGIATGSERGEGEGINMALKSGILAAEAVIETKDASEQASSIYLMKLKPVIEVCDIIGQNSVFYQSNWAEREKVLERIV